MFYEAFSSIKTTFILLLFTCFVIPAASAQNDPEVQAIQSFESGYYEDALPIFRDLVKLYPQDSKLNYYLAASLIETGQISAEAKKALTIASQNEPQEKIYYYKGIIAQSDNEWDKAINLYHEFASKAKKKDAKSTNLQKLIDQCKNQINPFKTEPKIVQQEPAIQEVPTENIVQDSVVAPKEIPVTIPEGLEDSILNFQINSEVKYLYLKHFKNEESKRLFIEGWLKDHELSELLKKTKVLRESYQAASKAKKEMISSEILEAENRIFELNAEIPGFYNSARNLENKYWREAENNELLDFKAEINRLTDSIQQQHNLQIKKNKESLEPDTLIIEIPEIITPEENMPEELITFKIQIGAYRGKLPDWVDRLFKKLSVIRKIENYTDDKGVTVYTTGNLKNYDEAILMQKQVQQEGVKDAIVAAYKNGVRISLSEAKKLMEQK